MVGQKQSCQKEGLFSPSARGVDAGTRSGQKAVTRGQWQLPLGTEEALLAYLLSGEAKNSLQPCNSAQVGAGPGTRHMISTRNKCNITVHVSYTTFHVI